MKVLLTGALGNVGLSTLEALLEEGHDVVAFDLESRRARKLASGLDGRVRVVWGDITDPESIRAALRRRGRGGPSGGHHSSPRGSGARSRPARQRRRDAQPDRADGGLVDGQPAGLRVVRRASSATSRIASRRSACRHARLSDRRVRAPEGGVRAGDPAVPAPVEHPAAGGGDAHPPDGHAQDPSIMFEFSPDARFEFLHPADAGTAFARAVACEESIGKTCTSPAARSAG